MSHPILAITSGEPAGVGPDLCAALPRHEWPARLVVLGDRAMIAARVHAVEPLDGKLAGWSQNIKLLRQIE